MSIDTTKVVTGKVRLSYAHIWEPKAIEEGATPKYSVALLIPKEDTKTIDAIKAAQQAAIKAGESRLKDAKGKLPANIKLPLRDGDVERSDDPNYEGCYFINCNSTTAPQVVEKIQGVMHAITDKSKVYSGCYARVSFNLYAFAVSGNKGVAAGLGNIQFLSDGEPLAGGSTAEQDFNDDFNDDDDFLN